MNSLESKSKIRIFFILFGLSAVAFTGLMVYSNGSVLSDILFKGYYGSDFFMDFFNSIRDASTKDVYKQGIIYPPLANMFFYFLSKMISPDLAATDFGQRLHLQSDYICLFMYLAFAFLTILLFINIVKKYMAKNGLQQYSSAFALVLVFSYPMIYCFQRGNIALLSLVFSLFFVLYRNSENKWLRELSFILLAVAAGIKLYPALFGVLLITDKKYKDAFRLIIYGVLALFLPFFFYDGFESITDLVNNLSAFSQLSDETVSSAFVSVDTLAMYANWFFGINYDSAYYFLFIITYLSAAAVLFVSPQEWQKLWAVAFMIMNYTSTSRTYILVLALIPFVVFICNENKRKADRLYFIVFALLLIVIPPLYYSRLYDIQLWFYESYGKELGLYAQDLQYIASPNQLLAAFLISGMTLFMFADILVRIFDGEIKLPFPKFRNKSIQQDVA